MFKLHEIAQDKPRILRQISLKETKGNLLVKRKIPIAVRGKFQTTMIVDNMITKQEVYVVPNLKDPLLGRPTIESLGLINTKEFPCVMLKKTVNLKRLTRKRI